MSKPKRPPPGFEKVIDLLFLRLIIIANDCSCNLQAKFNVAPATHPGWKTRGACDRSGGASGRRVQQVSTQSAFRFNDLCLSLFSQCEVSKAHLCVLKVMI